MRKFWRGGGGLAVWVGGLALALAAQAQETLVEKSQEPLALARPGARARQRRGPRARSSSREKVLQWKPAQTAIIICDMWNQHWCQGATRRVGELAPAMNRTIAAARARGVFIIHAPSSCMAAYQDHPARKRAQAAPKAANLPEHIGEWCNKIPAEEKGIYPIDQSDGGCDDGPQCPQGSPWKSQIAAIEIKDDDAISDSGAEIWNLLESRGHHQRDAHGRSYQYVRARPAVRPAEPGPVWQERRPGARPDRHDVQLADVALCQPLRGDQPDRRAHREVRRPDDHVDRPDGPAGVPVQAR